jgi:hypothetical protein
MYSSSQPITRFGINWKFGGDKPFVLGTFFHNNSPFENPFSPISVPEFDLYMFDEEYYQGNRKLDLFYGRQLGESVFGFHFGLVHSSDKDEKPTDLDEECFTQYNFDFGLTLQEGLLDLAAGIEFFTFKDIDTRDENQGTGGSPSYVALDDLKSKGNRAFYVRGRYFHEFDPTYSMVPHVGITLGKFKHEDYDWMQDVAAQRYNNELDWIRTYTLTDIDVGVGMHYSPVTRVLAILDVGVRSASVKTEYDYASTGGTTQYADSTFEYKDNYFVLPYFKAGFEADVFKWLDLRLGATSYWVNYTDENVVRESKDIWKFPLNRTYLGLGFNWDRLKVDCYVEPQLFLDGFYFISGTESGDRGMNCQITAIYEMF